MKSDGRLGRSSLKYKLGDCIHAVLYGCSHNLRPLLRYLEHFFAKILCWIIGLRPLHKDDISLNSNKIAAISLTSAYPLLMMFKALLLQVWHKLSDEQLERSLGRDLAFRRFVD